MHTGQSLELCWNSVSLKPARLSLSKFPNIGVALRGVNSSPTGHRTSGQRNIYPALSPGRQGEFDRPSLITFDKVSRLKSRVARSPPIGSGKRSWPHDNCRDDNPSLSQPPCLGESNGMRGAGTIESGVCGERQNLDSHWPHIALDEDGSSAWYL